MKYFFDSYALLAMFHGDKRYRQKILEGGVTTFYNLMEVYYGIQRQQGSQRADEVLPRIMHLKVEPSFNDIRPSMQLKKENKHMSYVDCLGYVMAKRLGLKFLTGDEEFRDVPDVEFLKAEI